MVQVSVPDSHDLKAQGRETHVLLGLIPSGSEFWKTKKYFNKLAF